MKSLTAVCQTGASMPAIKPNGRIARNSHQRGDGENAEMKMYLSKLKDLVPFMPKNRKLSKLEIIQHVIDYICDLQTELETHPEIGNFDAAGALNLAETQNEGDEDMLAERLNADELGQQLQLRTQQLQYHQEQQQQEQHSSPVTRQPLVDRQTPNTILPSVSTSSAAAQMQLQQSQQQHHHHQQRLLQQQHYHHQQQQQALATALSLQAQSAEKDSRQPC